MQNEQEKTPSLHEYNFTELGVFIKNSYAGSYGIGPNEAGYAVQFSFKSKPSLIHRFFSKLMLGWVWVDNN